MALQESFNLVEAAEYLQIDISKTLEFLRSGYICYKLDCLTILISKSELDRFKKECHAFQQIEQTSETFTTESK